MSSSSGSESGSSSGSVVRWGTAVVRMQSGGRRTLGTVLTWFVLVLGAFTFSAGMLARSSVGQRWDAAVQSFGAPDIAVRTTTKEALTGIAALPGVRPVGALTQRLQHGFLEGSSAGRTRSVVSTDLVPITIRMLTDQSGNSRRGGSLTRGRWLRSAGVNEVVLDASLAAELGIKIDEEITISRNINTATLRLKVVGLALDVSNCLLPDCSPGTLWVSEKVQSVLGPPSWNEFEQSFKVEDKSALTKVVANAYAAHRATVREVKTAEEIRSFVTLGNGLLGNVVAGFGLFALIASAILISSTTSTRLASLKRDIGLLQVIGAPAPDIAKIVLLQSVVLSLTASIVGWGAAQLISSRLVVGPASVLPSVGSPLLRSFLTVLAAVLTIVLASTIVPAVRAARVEVLSALRPRRNLTNRKGFLRVVPAGVGSLAIQTLTTQFRHFAVAAIALVVTGSAAVTAAGYDATLSGFADGSTRIGSDIDYRLVTDKPEQMASLDRALATDPDVAAWWKQTTRNVLIGGRRSQARFVEGRVADVGMRLRSGRYPQRTGEVVVGYALMKSLGSRIGDTVEVVAEDRTFPARIVGQVVDGGNGGRIATLLYNDLPENARWDLVRAMRFRKGASMGSVRTRMLRATLGPDQAPVGPGGNSARALPYRAALWGIALAVMGVGVAQLAASLLLATRSRARDLATLRTLGTHDNRIIRAHVILSTVVALLAALLALPIGLWFTRWSVDRISTDVGVGPGFALPSLLGGHLVMTVVLAFGCALTAAVVVRSQLARAVAGALRNE
jgi:ABC-type lipoprotein release transport system permease subunit